MHLMLCVTMANRTDEFTVWCRRLSVLSKIHTRYAIYMILNTLT
jgi:hypothetical protein